MLLSQVRFDSWIVENSILANFLEILEKINFEVLYNLLANLSFKRKEIIAYKMFANFSPFYVSKRVESQNMD